MVSTIVNISGYEITEELYKGSRTLVYRGYQKINSLPVVIKLLKNPYPSFSELVQFRNQYTIAKNLNYPGIIQTYSLEPYQNGYMLVMEDFGGISLKDYFANNNDVSLNEFLQIAIALCNTLNILYKERIIHKDIKPSNILINPETKQVKLIDFSIASLLPRETQTLINLNVLEGTLAYISPEQTGRMNRGIDYRTDFYSVGITFYELLTGKLPFSSNDAMELLHCHIAKIPIALANKKEIPQVISDIVMKLMAKNAEERYQSALGLKFDLENCLHQLQETGSIESFEIGQRDVCDRFIIPDKLYGRETEVKILLQAFERVSLGATEMMLVAGFSGIGKTAVVNEVHKPIVRQRGYFIKGKFDQFQRNIPFSAFVQAFRDLIAQLLTLSDIQLEQWKNKILDAVGENGRVIIEVIPELEIIIGQQPPAIELSGTAGQNRFNLLFQKFTQVFASVEHPLVMFLDDLQWADSASLNLMQILMADAGHLFIIGAYRDNEVHAAHPLILTWNQIAKSQATINTITLAPLSQVQVNNLVADTLKCTADLAWNLSVLIYQKTKGNPFFATQFLKALHQENLIQFDIELGFWQFDIAQVTTQAVTDDVVTFMALQLGKLPPSTQQILQLAACIGNQFDLATLAIVSEQSQIETAASLWKALQEGLILPIGDVYKFYVGQETKAGTPENQDTVTYKFIHDRVQQAAYSLIPDDQKQITHLQIGQLLLQNVEDNSLEANIFEIVNHLNLGIPLIDQSLEKAKLASLNLMAGQKAKNAIAYQPAFSYFQIGINLLAPECWQVQYDLALTLHERAGEVACLLGHFESMQQFIQAVFSNTHHSLDRVKSYQTQIQAYAAQGRNEKVMQTAMSVLQTLGVELPNQPSPQDIQHKLQQIALHLAEKRIEDLVNLDKMTDPKSLAIMQILFAIIPVLFNSFPQLVPLVILTKVELSIRFGNAALSPFAYALYGVILCGKIGDIDTGYQFGQLAMSLLHRWNIREVKSSILYVFNYFIKHWKQPIKETFSFLQEAYSAGLECGDIEHAAWSIAILSFSKYLAGTPLEELEKEMAVRHQLVHQTHQEIPAYSHAICYQAVLNLLSDATSPDRLMGQQYDETVMLPVHVRNHDLYAICHLYTNKLMLSVLFQDYQKAMEEAQKAEELLDSAVGMPLVPLLNFYQSLAQLANYADAAPAEQSVILQKVAVNQDRLEQWASHAPANYLHKFHLIEAQRQHILGNKAEAIDLYDRAIALAQEHGYIQEESLANELAAKFYLNWGKQRIAQNYMIEAYYGYARWGAKAKVADLERRYPQLLAPILQQTHSPFSTNETIFPLGTVTPTSSATSSSSSVSVALDLVAILKASQTISCEIEFEKLLSSLLSIVIENGGADKCVLMLMESEKLVIRALANENTKVDFFGTLLNQQPVEESIDVPVGLVNTVKRSLQSVVIIDASVYPQLIHDPYIVQYQPKSILCSPILHQGKLLGVLYLENNLTTGAFTSERVELLNLLCTQAAISLENARLYEREQQKSLLLEQTLNDLQNAQLQIVQSEKMSALGNLVAGVAHEMNNPLGFIAASLKLAKPTVADIVEHLKLYQSSLPNQSEEIIDHAEEIDLEYSLSDLPKILDSMTMACDRLQNISTSLRTFSRADQDYKVPFNIHQGIDSTILILKHRLKANEQRPLIEVVTNYGDLPQVECFPGQLNQVFMNLLANAIDALEESNHGRRFEEIKSNYNCITITTSVENERVKIAITDNGQGMIEQVKSKIFDHLFTTKAVGKGTGLGLAIAKSIVEQTHGGKLDCNSILGKGTEFIIEIPL